MRAAFDVAALALAATVATLLLTILVGRAARDRRTARTATVRPELELGLALYVADESSQPPVAVTPLARRTLEAVALEALAELRGRERARVTELLEKTGIVVELASRLTSRRRIVRRRAAEALSQIGSRDATDALAAGLADRDRDVRIGCARALAELGDDERLAQIASVLKEAAPSRTGSVEEVLLVLGIRDPSLLETVVKLSESDVLYRMVTRVAGSLQLAQLTPVLRANIRSSDEELVAASVRGLGRIGDLEAFDEILELLDGELQTVTIRAAAARALGRLGDPRAVPALEWALKAQSWSLRESAALALAQLGEPGAQALRKAATGWFSGREHARAVMGS